MPNGYFLAGKTIIEAYSNQVVQLMEQNNVYFIRCNGGVYSREERIFTADNQWLELDDPPDKFINLAGAQDPLLTLIVIPDTIVYTSYRMRAEEQIDIGVNPSYLTISTDQENEDVTIEEGYFIADTEVIRKYGGQV